MGRSREFRYEFDDLPLVIHNGVPAGLVAGSADISYFPDDEGYFSIVAIYLDGYRDATEAERAEHDALQVRVGVPADRRYTLRTVRVPVEVDAGDPIFLTILHRLEHEWAGTVLDAVNEDIAERRQCAADDYADAKREERALGVL